MAYKFTGTLSLDPLVTRPYHAGMEQEIQGLSERIERLIASVGRLSQERLDLQAALAQARQEQVRLQQRLDEARAHVESALSRMPLVQGALVPQAIGPTEGAGDHGTN
jgi:chromosome segregation ATPase